MFFLRSIWAILWKDLRVWVRQPANVAATLLPPLAFLLVEALGAAAVGRSPVALVVQDNGTRGAQVAQAIRDADVFRLQEVNAQQAQVRFKNLDVVAIITIPQDFTRQVQSHERAPINVTVNNLNLDFTNDIRRAAPDAITQYYQAQGTASPVKITMNEHDLRQQDVELFQYDVLPTLVLLLTICGLISTSLSTAREWETKTVKELLLAPARRGAIIAGKVLAGFATAMGAGILVLLIGYVLGWTRPEGIYWLNALVIMALVALLSAGLGVAIGALIQRVQPVIVCALLLALYLFFLSGGLTPIAFEPQWLQSIAAYVPLSYGNHALQMAVFYNSSDRFGRDVAVLFLSALAALVLGMLAIRRKIAG